MKTKIDKSLAEVWAMKSSVYNDFKLSTYSNFKDFIENDVKEFKIKNNIKNRKDLIDQS
jgi:hypothetical protein